MGRWWVSSLLILFATALPSAGETMLITQNGETAHYRVTLQIGPMEKMYSEADAAKMHPTSGEVMVGGAMAMGGMNMTGSMAMDTRHLEVHVMDRATGKVVTTAKCQIMVTNEATKKSEMVPVAMMYGVKEGPSDWHYGNNVSMPPGSYTVAVTIYDESATFHVTIQKM